MAKKAIKEEVLPVEQVVVEATPVVETEEAVEVGETIVEELPAPEVEEVVEEVFEITPEAEQAFAEAVEEEIQEVVEEVAPAVVEQVVAPRAGNEVGVRNIVQKTPSGFKLLLETGEIIRVSKSQYKKGDKTIIL